MKKTTTSYTLEYSHFNMPLDFPILGFTGDSWNLSDDKITFLHCHNCLEIGLCHKGSGFLFVEDKTVAFQEEDISIICPNTMHISQSDAGSTSNWEYVYIDTKRLFQEYLVPDFPNTSLFMFDSPEFPNIISGKQYPALRQMLLLILKELHEPHDHSHIQIACLCISFLVELARLLPLTSDPAFDLSKAKLTIYPAIEYVEKNYMHPFKIEMLSDACCLSITHFRRLFKAIMHVSPLDYVNRMRVHKACELLYNTEDSILNIALSVGFSDNTALNRNFSRIMGVSPLRWRKQTRSIAKNNLKLSVFPSWLPHK